MKFQLLRTWEGTKMDQRERGPGERLKPLHGLVDVRVKQTKSGNT